MLCVLYSYRRLDAGLAALSRDFIQFRAGWFSRFHEALEPTPAERSARVDAYLRLLGSSIPPTVAFALNAVAFVDETQPLPASRLLGALQPVLAARGKAVVKTALQLLGHLAKRDPAARAEVCIQAVPALLNEATDVQKSVFDLLENQGDIRDSTLRTKIGELAGAVAASLKSRLAKWLGESATAAQPKRALNSNQSELPFKVPSRVDPARAVQPIADLDDLIHTASAVLE